LSLYDTLKQASPFFLIAGPCVIEDTDTMLYSASFLQELCHSLNLPLVFKSSFRKANRTAVDSPSGPGIEEGLRILSRIKSEFELPILSDIHESSEAAVAAEVCDILQIPAFLCRQTELIRAAAATGKIVNLKKGQFMAPEDMLPAAQKAGANQQIMLTERGSSFGYHNLVVDFRSFSIMESFGYPVVYDVTHSLQMPSSGRSTGGTPEYAPLMARAAIATGKVRGLFIEAHPEPANALSDAATMLPLNALGTLLRECIEIAERIPGGR